MNLPIATARLGIVVLILLCSACAAQINRSGVAAMNMRIRDVKFNHIQANDALSEIRKYTAADLTIDWDEMKFLGISSRQPISFELHNITFRDLLEKYLEAAGLGKLEYRIDDDAIVIVATAQAKHSAEQAMLDCLVPPIELNGRDLFDVVQYLKDSANVPISMNRQELRENGIDVNGAPLVLSLKNAKLADVLDALISETVGNLAYSIQAGEIILTSRRSLNLPPAVSAASQMEQRIEDVQFDQTPFLNAIEILQREMGCRIIVDETQIMQTGTELKPVTWRGRAVKGADVLSEVVTQAGSGKLAAVVDGGDVKIFSLSDIKFAATRPASPILSPDAQRVQDALQARIEKADNLPLSDAINSLTGPRVAIDWAEIRSLSIQKDAETETGLKYPTRQEQLKTILATVGSGKLDYLIDGSVLIISSKEAITRISKAQVFLSDDNTQAAMDRNLHDIAFDEIPFGDAIATLIKDENMPIEIRWPKLKAAGIDARRAVSIRADKLRTARVLEIILKEASPEKLAYVIKDGMIVISTRDDLLTN